MLISSTREHNSQGGREYRKGKQERKVTPGNRIREIEMPHKPLDVKSLLWKMMKKDKMNNFILSV